MARRGRRRSRISASDLAGYGSVANGTVDVDRAARGLGASKRDVRRAIRQAQAAQSNTFLRRISGRREADSAEGSSMRGMLQAVFGRGPRGGAVNARAAAQSLGVSQGTVRRWAAGTQQPSKGRLASIRAAARRVTTTKRGRRGPRRTSAAAHKAGRRFALAAKSGSAVSKAWAATTRVCARSPRGQRHQSRGDRGPVAGL